jgi:hypothetical protein
MGTVSLASALTHIGDCQPAAKVHNEGAFAVGMLLAGW